MRRLIVSGVTVFVAGLLSSNVVQARGLFQSFNSGGQQSAAAPAICITQHDVGNMVLGVQNNGTFGDFDDNKGPDCFTGLPIKACEFPKGSNTRYLYAGAFWIGAVSGRDTLVSVGADGWRGEHEMFPDQAPLGDIIYRSITDPSKPQYDGAVSEQDFIAVYYDTCTRDCPGLGADVIDGRQHRPLGLEITQRSFAWSYAYAQNFVLFDYAIKNIGRNRLKRVYMGIYVDADVYADATGNPGAQDDVCGFKQSLPAWYSSSPQCQYQDTIDIAWIADNDGDLTSATGSVPNVTGTRIVRTPSDTLDVSFNWWISNGNAALDFGPQGRKTYRPLEFGNMGTPEGDRAKYWFLRNKEFDYDQAYVATIGPLDTNWIYPPQNSVSEWARGMDTRYLLSFGPFDIEPGQVLPLSFSYVGGLKFHSNPSNLDNLPLNPDGYYRNLDFSNLGYNCTWSSWIYDTPGFDTDDDNYAGKYHLCVLDSVIDSIYTDTTGNLDTAWLYRKVDTVWYEGDGVPDFKGASPPPAPKVWVQTTVGKILVRFNGLRSETTRDEFSKKMDFEGYRVYYSRDDRSSSYSLLESYDREDFNKFVWDSSKGFTGDFVLKDIPYTLSELRCAYAPLGCNDSAWNPLDYPRSHPFRIPGTGDSVVYFAAQDYNRSTLGTTTKIAKRYPNQLYPQSLNKDSCQASDTTDDGYFKYFEYEYTIDNLLPTVSYYVNVTAFDFGSPASGLPSLESPLTFQSKVTFALESVDSVIAKNLKVAVYPNPYRVDANYAQNGYEGTTLLERSQVPDRNRRIHFYNLLPKCTIRIFTLDGDLVRQIDHNFDASDPLANHDTWDLITRNTQMAVSGLYYWTVEFPDGNVQMGKLVLIM